MFINKPQTLTRSFLLHLQERAYSTLHSDSGQTLVIATSGITTGTQPNSFTLIALADTLFAGTNPKQLLRLAIWKGVYKIESAVQAVGRVARVQGQVRCISHAVHW
jgi:hypothetical protein